MSHLSPEHLLTQLWHTVTPEQALERLESQSSGLNADEARRRADVFGPNLLPKPKRRHPVVVFLLQFKSPLIYMLLAAAGISVLIGDTTDAVFIFIVLQINALIGAVQEMKAESSAEALKKLIPSRVTVRRGGHPMKIDTIDLTPGDVVLLESGLLVPADIHLLTSVEVKADESLLTGESLPVSKTHKAVLAQATHLGDRVNMLHAGSTVISGRAEGVVTQIGGHTELGRIASSLASTEQAQPPLVMRLERFTRNIGYLVLVGVAILVMVQLQRGMALADIFFTAIALAVAAIPEGLPAGITVALSVGAMRMARRHVILRSLPAVEGLGACTVIASDKTGTLTCNELTVKALYLPDGRTLGVSGEGYDPTGEVDKKDDMAVHRLALTGALCNESGFYPEPDGTGYRHFGDTVDVAFLVLGRKVGLFQEQLKKQHTEVDFIPFESERKYAVSFHSQGTEVIAHVKGAAEVVLPMCGHVDLRQMLKAAETLAADGYRVLALARGPVTRAEDSAIEAKDMTDLEFLGFAALIDPVRAEVPESVRHCDHSGVSVCMITGDHPATALAIARNLGIAHDRDQVVTGSELSELSGDQAAFDDVVKSARVFARVEPIQKLSIVQALRRLGHFVAVTGDGVNDAPALRAANIGVAMGKGGTDVARGAAQLILTDDNFASIVGGIEEGRIAYDNVRKVIYLLVSAGVGEIFLFMLTVAFGLAIPLFAAQLLWLNLVTNGIQHLALAFEKGEPGVLDRKPRPPRQRIFDQRMIEQTVISGGYVGVVAFAYFGWALMQGVTEAQARNEVLMLMVLFGNAHVFNCRSEWLSTFKMSLRSNVFLFAAVFGAQGIHILATFIPGLRDILGAEPLSLESWIKLLPLALGLIVVMELYKALTKRMGRHP